MKVCRICLSKDCRLYPITSNGLRSLYYQLTGVLKLEVDVDKRLPQWMCAECGLRLLSYDKLRQKSLKSYKIICQFLEKATSITEEDINQIDRQKNDLQSNLSYVVLDHSLIHEDGMQEAHKPESKPKQEIEECYINVDLGESSLVFKTEKDSDDCCSETAVSDSKSNKDSDSDSNSDIDACLSSDSSGSVNKLLNNISNNLSKQQDKKVCLNIQKEVDACLNSLNKTAKATPKRVLRVKKKGVINKQVISKGNPYPIEEVFTVLTLSMEEQMVEFEKRKFSRSYTSAPLKCNKCFKGFITQLSFDKHQLLHADKSGKVECKICKIRFHSIQSSYHTHMNIHKTMYSCRECPYKTSQRPMALLHWSKHKGKTYKCLHCDMEFVNQNSYMRHLKIKHVSRFVCEYCGHFFVNDKGVELHKIVKHKLGKNNHSVITDGPTCETCNIKFVSDEALNTHVRLSHTQQSDGKRRHFDRPYEKNIICELCGVKSADSRAYRTHHRRHHQTKTNETNCPNKPRAPQQFMCEQCGRVFQNKNYMQNHALLHSGQKPYECHDCHKQFSSKQNIKLHILRKHLPPDYMELKPGTKAKSKARFTCSICGKEFASDGNRKRHMAVHSNLRPFICEICGSSFKTKCDVKLHTKHVHMKVPWPKKHERGSRQWN